MTSWTEEQHQAINLEGNNIIVSAGAGSGKTAVLSERVLRKAHDGIHVDRLLILTFTNAAAAEIFKACGGGIEGIGFLEKFAYKKAHLFCSFNHIGLF